MWLYWYFTKLQLILLKPLYTAADYDISYSLFIPAKQSRATVMNIALNVLRELLSSTCYFPQILLGVLSQWWDRLYLLTSRTHTNDKSGGSSTFVIRHCTKISTRPDSLVKLRTFRKDFQNIPTTTIPCQLFIRDISSFIATKVTRKSLELISLINSELFTKYSLRG